MFNDIQKNKEMFEGAYRKLKSYYYYNKNFIVMRKKIVDFESDQAKMEQTFNVLANIIKHPKAKKSKIYLEDLYKQIDFYIIPKKFEPKLNLNPDRPVSNTVARDKKMKTVNFFINMPIEFHLIDTLLCLFIAKIAEQEKLITSSSYANTILSTVINNPLDGSIDFQNNRLFNMYFYQYTRWRNNAFRKLETNYDKGKDSVLISLDLQGFFYSIRFSFNKLKKMCGNNVIYKKIYVLTNIMEKIFNIYKEKIFKYRIDIKQLKTTYPLPIGLFTSMVLANIYMYNFDKNIEDNPNISYYGRYVDDLLFVYDKKINTNSKNDDIIQDTLIKDCIIKKCDSKYTIKGFENLEIQKNKIKIIYLDHNESRALIDIYNDTIRIIPSQMNPIPDFGLNLSSFDETAYNIERFSKENKLRDIGNVNVDAYRVSKFFAMLVTKFSKINSFENGLSKEINSNIKQIENFFTGSQCIEFYPNWMNYMYFLVLTQRHKELSKFYHKAKKQINNLDYKSLDKKMYTNIRTINKKAREYLINHLDICRLSALCLDISMVKRHFCSLKNDVYKYIYANLFNHSFVALPMINYLDYKDDVSYVRMGIDEIGDYIKVSNYYKFKWSPRFIHYDEILMLIFYYGHKHNKRMNLTKAVEKFVEINHLAYKETLPFKIDEVTKGLVSSGVNGNQYELHKFYFPTETMKYPDKINLAVASLKLQHNDILPVNNKNKWKQLSLGYKKIINNILMESYRECEQNTRLLVFPELSLPIYWLGDIIRYSKKTQTAIIGGLQYLVDDKRRVYNYILSIFPFKSGKYSYKNAFVHIREKNDYSPLEIYGFEKDNYCIDAETASYYIYQWKNINISSFVCYELTDIVARAMLKGKCDIIAAPVFNKDTTYFSNIIDTTVRDLSVFIVQSNTSIYGDSRVTGPYSRDYKDILKIKGGDNDNLIIGTINFDEYTSYQKNYYKNYYKKYTKKRKKESQYKTKTLSARFFNKRTVVKRQIQNENDP